MREASLVSVKSYRLLSLTRLCSVPGTRCIWWQRRGASQAIDRQSAAQTELHAHDRPERDCVCASDLNIVITERVSMYNTWRRSKVRLRNDTVGSLQCMF